MLSFGFNKILFVLASPGRVSPSPSQESLCSSKSDTDPGVRELITALICGLSGLQKFFFFFFFFLEEF